MTVPYGLPRPMGRQYGDTLTVVRQRRLRHGDRGEPYPPVTTGGWRIAPDTSTEDTGTTRTTTTTRLKAYGGPPNPDIRRDDRVHLAHEPRTDRQGRPTEPRWQVDGDIERWGPGKAVVTLKRVSN